jgi:16S rRNA (cytosine1402-N4)-methyltransferase
MKNQTDKSNGNQDSYHQPVMLVECLEALNIRPEGVYVDATFGGGGHSLAILAYLTIGRLIAFDQDEDAASQAANIQSRSFTFCKANFRFLQQQLKLNGLNQVDGVLADLGVSSHQIDAPLRGFSTRYDGPLDMRMNYTSGKTAADVINTYDEQALHRLFGMYGEIKNARTAAKLVLAKRIQPIKTTFDLKNALREIAPRGKENKWFAQVFQALRIEVNNELKALEEFLFQCVHVIRPGGRLVVMSYHSLEDRMVKNFMNTGKIYGEVEKDVFGNQIKPFSAVNKKPVMASEDEVEQNGRARSARLRVAERNV